MLRHVISGSICVFALLCATVAFVAAAGPETQDVTVTFTDDGDFAVAFTGTGEEGSASFGVVELDALDDVSRTIELELSYTDTHTDRGGGDVTLSATSFFPDEPVPPFPGSDLVDFQIPERYLALTSIGPIEPDGTVDCAPPGSLIAPADAGQIEGATFDEGGALKIATTEEGCGVGMATQTIGLTLTVPAGVYPTDYTATLTVETTIDELPDDAP